MEQNFDWGKLYDNMTTEERLKAAQYTMQRFNYASNYWDTMFTKGKKCQDYLVGNILTKEELQEFDDQDKLAVQAPEALPKINSIVGMLADTAKDGVVVAARGEDAPGSEVINTILKCIERDNQLRRKELQAAQDTIVTSVPNWIWLDGYDPYDSDKVGLNLDLQPWDSVLPDPSWRDPQLRDIRFIIRIKQLSVDMVEETYPNADIEMLRRMDPIDFGYVSATEAERNELFARVRSSREQYSRTGLINVIEMLHWVRVNTVIWFNEETGESHVPPATWNDDQKMEWQMANPGFQEIKSREKVLWVTTSTMDSKLLANGPHWLQCNRLPCVPYVSGLINNKFAGLLEFSLSTLKAGVYAKSEWIHSIRTQNNNLWKIMDGSVADIDEFQKQRTRPGGTIVVQPGSTLDDLDRVENAPAQNAFLDWAKAEEDLLSRLTVERNFEGGMQTSQESAKAINSRIKQVISRLSPMVYGWHEFRMNLRRLIVKAIPYTYTEHTVFRYFDPANGLTQAEVNVPQEITDGIYQVMNNLNGADYDYIETEADNSVTGQEHERLMFREFMESYGNMPPDELMNIALSYPSTLVQKIGKSMLEQKQNQAPPNPAENAKMSISLDADNLGANPLAQKVAVNAGLLKPEDVETAQQGEQIQDVPHAPMPGE